MDSTFACEFGSDVRGRCARHRLLSALVATCLSAACQLDVSPRGNGAAVTADGADMGDRDGGIDGERITRSRLGDPDTGAADPVAAAHEGPDTGDSDAAEPERSDAGEADPDAADGAPGDPPACLDDEPQTVACGLNGRGEQPQRCVQGEFVDDGPCGDPDACVDDDTHDLMCGPNGSGTQAQRCVAGQWQDEGGCADADTCANDDNRVVACGLNDNGTLPQRCAAGQWVDDGPCTDPDVCANDHTRIAACGPNGNGTRLQHCIAGQWEDAGPCADRDVCANGAMRGAVCGVLGGGTRPQRCISGQWQDAGDCNDPDWTCPISYYGTGDGCDCECGSRDPDCDVAGQIVLNCGAEEFCDAQGECADIPSSWECDPDYYATRDGCDCDCGAYDLDCAVPGQTLYGCSAGQTCSAAGICQ